jgi:hypothetical protein
MCAPGRRAASLHLEILALRHQLTVVNRSRRRRTRFTSADRLLWAGLSRVWRGWRSALYIVRPDTVVAWHRRGFRLFWTWKSRRRTGRPSVPADVRALIRELSTANPLWGAPRIHGELQKLGISVSQSTVATFMRRAPRPPSHTWRTFLTNHASQIMAADLFVVPSVTFQLLFVLVVLAHDRRRVVHVAVTRHPTAAWTAQQLRNAFPDHEAPRYLLHDRDSVFADVATTTAGMNIQTVRTAPRSPRQNAYVERVIGSIRRECLDHVIVVNASGLHRVLSTSRTTCEHVPISLSAKTRRSRARSRRHQLDGSSRHHMSADCTTATIAALPSRRVTSSSSCPSRHDPSRSKADCLAYRP